MASYSSGTADTQPYYAGNYEQGYGKDIQPHYGVNYEQSDGKDNGNRYYDTDQTITGNHDNYPQSYPFSPAYSNDDKLVSRMAAATIADSAIQKSDRYICGTTGKKEPLDGTFRVRSKDYKMYFTPGRVFKILWTKEPITRCGSFESLVDFGKWDKKVVCGIRRFIVLETVSGSRSCKCLPVTTYNNQGLQAKGISFADHGRILARESRYEDANGISGVESLYVKLSLGVHSSEIPNLLVVNYAKVYTIEMNVKVKDIGELTKSSKVTLASNFQTINALPEYTPAPALSTTLALSNALYITGPYGTPSETISGSSNYNGGYSQIIEVVHPNGGTRKFNAKLDSGNEGPILVNDNIASFLDVQPNTSTGSVSTINGYEVALGGELDLQFYGAFRQDSDMKVYFERCNYIPYISGSYDVLLNENFMKKVLLPPPLLYLRSDSGRQTTEEERTIQAAADEAQRVWQEEQARLDAEERRREGAREEQERLDRRRQHARRDEHGSRNGRR